MEKSGNKKVNKVVILSVTIIVVTLIMALVFIYMPFLNRNRTLRAEILRERDRNVLIGKIRALGRHLKVYEKKIPQDKDVSWLMGRVSDMAKKEGIEISSMKPDAPKDRGLYTELSVILDTGSTYDQIGKFISRVESSKEFLKIESINIKRLGLDKEFNEASARFKAFDVKGHIVISTVVFKE